MKSKNQYDVLKCFVNVSSVSEEIDLQFRSFLFTFKKEIDRVSNGKWKNLSKSFFSFNFIEMIFSDPLQPPSLFTLKGFLVLDSHGRRVLAHYYDPDCLATTQSQNAFERKLFRKTAKTNVEVLIQDNLPICYK